MGSAVRIFLKLHHLISNRLSSSFSKEGLGLGSKRRDEDLRAKAIKALDLLEHSAELGNTDALFTIGLVSLVRGLFSLSYCFSTLTILSVPTKPPLQS